VRRRARPTATQPSVPEPVTRREEILAIAAELFAEQGVSNTTVRDIAKKAGILSGSLYHHFTSKDEMLDEIIQASLDSDIALDAQLASQEDFDPATAIRALFGRSLGFVHDHPHVATIVNNDPERFRNTPTFDLVRKRSRAVRVAWTAVLARCVATGEFRQDLDVDLTYLAMISIVDGASHWYRPDGTKSISQIADELTALFLDGLRGPSGPGPTDDAPAPTASRRAPVRAKRPTANRDAGPAKGKRARPSA
jgi:TetR/AcrR family transcriptional regulator, cholesterol catabolism regulator